MLARRLLAITLVLSTFAAACSSTTDAGPQPAHIIVTPDAVTIQQHGSASLTVAVTDKDDQLLTGAAVAFSSSNIQMVTVTNLGVITSVGPAGTATVTVKSGKASTPVTVTITPVTSGITVSPDPASLAQKTTLQLQAKVVDAVGAVIPNATITYTPANSGILTVSPSGLVQSVGPAGNTSITLSSGAVTRILSVTVAPVPSELRVYPSTVVMGIHGQTQLSATVLDAVGSPILPTPATTWSSADPTIATVSATGLVTSVGPLGNTSITAKSGAFSATIPVQVATFGRPSGNTITTTNLGGAWGIGISPNGTIIAPSSDGQHSYRVDAIAGTVTPVNGVTGGLDVAFSPDGVKAYVANTNSNRVDIVDVASNSVTGSFPTVQPLAVQVSRDNSTLYVGSGGLVVAYDLGTKAEKTRMSVPGTVNAINPHPSLDLIYATAYDGATVAEINTSSNTVTRTFHVAGTAQESAVTTDGNTLFVAIEGSDLALFDLTNGTQLPSVTGGGGFGAALTPDGQELWVVGGGSLKIINTTSHAIRTVTLPLGGRRIVFSGDGSTAVITGEGSGLMFVR